MVIGTGNLYRKFQLFSLTADKLTFPDARTDILNHIFASLQRINVDLRKKLRKCK